MSQMWLRSSCLLDVPAFEDGNQRTLDLREGQGLSDLVRLLIPLVIRLIFVLLKNGLASGFLSPARLVLVPICDGKGCEMQNNHIHDPSACNH